MQNSCSLKEAFDLALKETYKHSSPENVFQKTF